MSQAFLHPWRYRTHLSQKYGRHLLRPICWIKGHESRMRMVAVFVSEDAPKPPSSYCERCGKPGV